MSCGDSLFGASSQYIKVSGGDFVAIQGSETIERQMLSDLRIPYKQVLRGRVILKPGVTSYLLNFLGLGDNATFLCIKATYNSKSVNEEDNYITWSYYDDFYKIYAFDQLMVLTGNSSHRIPQLYLTNPNATYAINLDVMVAVIDDEYSFFGDVMNQVGTSFMGLNYADIQTHVIGQSIVIYDKSAPPQPLIYINLSDINTLELSGTVVILDDSSHGKILLSFLSEFDADQAMSILNYVLENPTADIATFVPPGDTIDPTIYFYSHFGGTQSGSYISFNGATAGVPYNTSYGFTFSTSASLSTYGTVSGTYSIIDRSMLITYLVSSISDNRDGTMSMIPSNLVINSGAQTQITATGSYVLTFDYSDIAQNYLTGIFVNLNITA